MVTRRNALGRGLDALIPPPRPVEESAPSAPPHNAPGAVKSSAAVPTGRSELRVDEIAANPEQPRRVFGEAELARLAESIRRHGVLQPVVVRRAPAASARPYELVVGERRWRATQLAGRETIPATIQDVAPRDLLELALVENVQRQDLNPIELAQAFRALLEQGATQEEVGRRVGLDRSTVANHLRLLDLPRPLQADVEEGALTAGHAKALLSVTDPQRRRLLRDRVIAEQLSVRATEELSRRLGGARRRARPPRRGAQAADPNLQALIDALRSCLQTQVRIRTEGGRGRLEIDFYDAEDLHRISQRILDGARI